MRCTRMVDYAPDNSVEPGFVHVDPSAILANVYGVGISASVLDYQAKTASNNTR